MSPAERRNLQLIPSVSSCAFYNFLCGRCHRAPLISLITVRSCSVSLFSRRFHVPWREKNLHPGGSACWRVADSASSGVRYSDVGHHESADHELCRADGALFLVPPRQPDRWLSHGQARHVRLDEEGNLGVDIGQSGGEEARIALLILEDFIAGPCAGLARLIPGGSLGGAGNLRSRAGEFSLVNEGDI